MSYKKVMKAHQYWLKSIGTFHIHMPFQVENKQKKVIEKIIIEIMRLASSKEKETALKYCSELSKKSKKFSESGLINHLNAIVKTYIDEIDFSDIERDFEISIEKSPNNSGYYFNMGLFYIIRKRFISDIEKAIEKFSIAIKHNPDFFEAYQALSLIHTLSNNWKLGLDNCKKALSCNSDKSKFLINLCMTSCTYELGQEIEGAYNFESIIKLKRNPDFIKNSYLLKLDSSELTHKGESIIIFIACDSNYFIEHLITLIWSLKYVKSEYSIHVHIFNPTKQVNDYISNIRAIIWPTKLYVSTETVDKIKYSKTKVYYSSVRFCRFYELGLANPNCKIIMVDADSLFRKSPRLLFESIESSVDIGISYCENNPMWDQFPAALIYSNSTEKANKFLSEVSQFVMQNLKAKSEEWFLDQVALFISYKKLKEDVNISFFTESQVPTINFNNKESIIWVVVNELKKQKNLYNIYKKELINLFETSIRKETPKTFTIN
tara:strand:+ start:260 stop:1735 length:1476 start_codon:yes stop_codon:yes gene_type:complete